jgi:NAD(P)H dehydrogenase (quinone)
MILVTGSTGGLGKEAINALTKLVPPEQIVALARDPEKASAYKEAKIIVRKGDYADYNSLVEALTGVDRLLMISAPAFSEHSLEENMIKAAKATGVKYIVYTGIARKEGSGWVIPDVTERGKAMERLLAESGIAYTIAYNTLYADSIPFLLGSGVLEQGVLLPSGAASATAATRADLGEALAKVISSDTYYPEQITLANNESWSRHDIAAILSDISGKDIPVVDATPEAYIAYQESLGIPSVYASFAADWAATIAAGELDEKDELLAKILGRKPTDLATYFKTVYRSGV